MLTAEQIDKLQKLDLLEDEYFEGIAENHIANTYMKKFDLYAKIYNYAYQINSVKYFIDNLAANELYDEFIEDLLIEHLNKGGL